MPRQLILALGLAALALTFGPRPFVHSTRAEAPTAAAEEHAHGDPNILEPQPPLAVWTVVVFLGLLFVLGKFAWKPIIKALHDREEHLQHCLTETERARNDSEHLLAEHRRQLALAAEEVRALLEQGRRDAQAAAEDILQKARAEIDAERQRSKREIETARDQALAEIWKKTADLAVSVAGRVLTKELSETDHRRLVDSAIGALPARTNGHGSHA